MKQVFITGISSGIGEALTKKYLEDGYFVYGLSKSKPNIENKNLKFLNCDLSDLNIVKPYVLKFLHETEEIDHIILNAGILGKIEDMRNISTETLNEIFNINLWSNKEIIDAILDLNIGVKQIIAVSSSASLEGKRGWGGYALSKTALNMLIQLYAEEIGDKIHLSAITPGLVDTKMVKLLFNTAKINKYNSISDLEKLSLKSVEDSANELFDAFFKLKKYRSGSFINVKDVF
jgi:NAD(P)-dependent dehydrogenase (short-subunit alcohol dehydrogenase family)